MKVRLKDEEDLKRFWNKTGIQNAKIHTNPDRVIFLKGKEVLFNKFYEGQDSNLGMISGYNIVTDSGLMFLYADEVVTEKEDHDTLFNNKVDELLK